MEFKEMPLIEVPPQIEIYHSEKIEIHSGLRVTES